MSKKATLEDTFKRLKQEAKPILDAALRTGAINVGNQLLRAANDVNDTTNQFKRLGIAVRNGFLTSVQEMTSWGLDSVKTSPPPGYEPNVPGE
ncbi:hypothetical protein [Cohnella terricola]|uniref:Uncharacterized protein n=1 Tax=Cohnella terricola TaxID=1289167 RepID=A0A559JDH0_9BACL|nr:hypothetical protein [Cohnella terricola]TVX97924.1 hypothetical protein FPZ45_16890 [Cohnella terricola]